MTIKNEKENVINDNKYRISMSRYLDKSFRCFYIREESFVRYEK